MEREEINIFLFFEVELPRARGEKCKVEAKARVFSLGAESSSQRWKSQSEKSLSLLREPFLEGGAAVYVFIYRLWISLSPRRCCWPSPAPAGSSRRRLCCRCCCGRGPSRARRACCGSGSPPSRKGVSLLLVPLLRLPVSP